MIWSYHESASNWNMWRPPSFPKACTAPISFLLPLASLSPLRPLQTNRTQTDQIHSLLMLTEREGAPELGEDPLWTQLGRAVGTPYPFHSHPTKRARRHKQFLWKLGMHRRQQQTREMKHKTNHPMPLMFQIFHIFKCPSLLALTLFSWDFPCSVSSFRRAHMLSDCFFIPSL